jgi:hypothetical protein
LNLTSLDTICGKNIAAQIPRNAELKFGLPKVPMRDPRELAHFIGSKFKY